jgi:hypothetical protein
MVSYEACQVRRDDAPCEITNTTGTPVCSRCQIVLGGWVVGEVVTISYHGRDRTGPITGFDIWTTKWSNQAGARVKRAKPAGFATVLLEPGTATRGSFSVSEFTRKLRRAS